LGKKGGVRHLKRMPAPAFWPLHKKEFQWAPKPVAGPHPAEKCLPLMLIVRDILHYAKNAREAKIMLSEGRIKVDGKVRGEPKYPAGLMDVIEAPDAKSVFRILPSPGRGLDLVKISKEESSFKLCRIENMTTVRGGDIQLNLHDGRNILIKAKDLGSSVADSFETLDTVQLALKDQKILKRLKFREGSYAIVTSGRNIGKSGKIVRFEQATAARPGIVTIEGPQGETFQTTPDYVFIVGDEKPLIALSGG